MKTLRVGIASYEQMKERTIAIAKGEYKPGAKDPNVWFTSMESLAKILSDKNRALLHLIIESSPGSLAELADMTGRKKSNLSRTLKTMENYGLVELKKNEKGRLIPKVPYSDIRLSMPVANPGFI